VRKKRNKSKKITKAKNKSTQAQVTQLTQAVISQALALLRALRYVALRCVRKVFTQDRCVACVRACVLWKLGFRFFTQRTQAPANRNGRLKQPIMVASASACVARVFRTQRTQRKHLRCVRCVRLNGNWA